jgi:putative chitinase
MILTKEHLKFLVPYSSLKDREKFLDPLNETINRYNINTPLRLAAFIAQIAHESGSLHYVEELASGSAYEYRRDLGNLEPEALKAAHSKGRTTGPFYKGYGLIQITGYYNHKSCGLALGYDGVNEPEKLKEPLYAALSAGWFWDCHHLNDFADIGDFKQITLRINGGLTNYKARLINYERCKKF